MICERPPLIFVDGMLSVGPRCTLDRDLAFARFEPAPCISALPDLSWPKSDALSVTFARFQQRVQLHPIFQL